MNIKIFAIEYEMEWATPRISPLVIRIEKKMLFIHEKKNLNEMKAFPSSWGDFIKTTALCVFLHALEGAP